MRQQQQQHFCDALKIRLQDLLVGHPGSVAAAALVEPVLKFWCLGDPNLKLLLEVPAEEQSQLRADFVRRSLVDCRAVAREDRQVEVVETCRASFVAAPAPHLYQ